MREELRFAGKIMGATVSFSGGRWFISVQVETDGRREPAPIGTTAGVDLGSRTLATIAGINCEIEPITGPKPRRRLVGRIKHIGRRISRQKHRAKKAQGVRTSRRQYRRQLQLLKLHAHLANIRKDAAHKLTTGLPQRFQTIVIEDLNVSGMTKNHGLAGAVLDGGWQEIRRRLQYKTIKRGGRVVVADRFFPSTQICSCCGAISGPKGREEFAVEQWICCECGTEHRRDANAAINMRKLGLAEAESTRGDTTPLPACASVSASVADEPPTETVSTCAHI
jgi:putative transposase